MKLSHHIIIKASQLNKAGYIILSLHESWSFLVWFPFLHLLQFLIFFFSWHCYIVLPKQRIIDHCDKIIRYKSLGDHLSVFICLFACSTNYQHVADHITVDGECFFLFSFFSNCYPFIIFYMTWSFYSFLLSFMGLTFSGFNRLDRWRDSDNQWR